MIQKIDDYLIDNVFQKLSEKYQLRTYRTNFYLAIILFVVYGIIDILQTMSWILQTETTVAKFILLFMSLVFYGIIYFKIRVCKKLDVNIKANLTFPNLTQ